MKLQIIQGEATRRVVTFKCVLFYILFSRLYKFCDDSTGDGLFRRKHAVVLATGFWLFMEIGKHRFFMRLQL